MTKLVLEELMASPLVQEFDWTPQKRAHLTAVRPHLYVHNSPAGTFNLAVLDEDDNELVSKNFTAADIYFSIGTANAYAHVTYPVIFDSQVNLPTGRYKISLSATGYTFSGSAYLAWVRDHEDLKVPLTYTPANDLENPLTFEIWVN